MCDNKNGLDGYFLCTAYESFFNRFYHDVFDK